MWCHNNHTVNVIYIWVIHLLIRVFSTIKPFFLKRYYRWEILLLQAFQTSLWCQNPFMCLFCKRFTCPTPKKLWKKLNFKIWSLLNTESFSPSVNITLLYLQTFSPYLEFIKTKSWSKYIVWPNTMHSVLNLLIDKKGENNTATNIFLYTVYISIEIK